MPDPRNISISDYTYTLPEEKIALHPLPQRDAAKLLIYKNEVIEEDVYSNIANYIPAESLLVFNNTRVINARLRFQKSSGGMIEIFCLEPFGQLREYNTMMNQTDKVTWKCLVGGAAKWKSGALQKRITINNEEIIVEARLLEKISDAFIIQFSWPPGKYSFAEIIETAGHIPLPPYIKREVEPADQERYQTIFARHNGSVAAPTAGLHFTEKIFNDLRKKNVAEEHITLHVGAGTFKPVKAAMMADHDMHAEWIDVSVTSLTAILNNENVIAVGTTSARTLETLYWLGLKLMINPDIAEIRLSQWEIYDKPLVDSKISSSVALQALINWLNKWGLRNIFTQTQLLITPGYKFRIIKAIITNFHQPQSTLLLLVAAATHGKWKNLYDYALANHFRFLSYGDGNLIFI